MPYIHEFGIIACIEKDKEYAAYEPEKYNCIGVDGDLFDELLSKDFGKNTSPRNFCTTQIGHLKVSPIGDNLDTTELS